MRRFGAVMGMVVAVCASCGVDETLDTDAAAVSVARKVPKACKTKKSDRTKPPKAREKNCSATTVVGATGGVVEHPGGVTLTVPAGAVDADVAISVVDEGAAGPDGTQMFSPVFTFEPDGTLFARPVQVQFEVPASITDATVYWSRTTATGTVWDRIPATVSGGIATSQITHFSGGGAGEPSDVFDLHIIQTVTWDRLDSQHIERTDFASGAAVAHAPGGDIASEAWIGSDGNPKPGEGMIRNVPAGEMWIQIGKNWVFTSLAQTPVLDFSREKFGTFGRATPDINLPHPVTINVTGAETTTAADMFELLVPDANAFVFAFPEDTGVPIAPLGVNDFRLDWDLNSPAAKDNFITTADTAYVAQLAPRTTPPPASLPYSQMTKIGVAAPADVPQAGGTLDVVLQDLPANATPRSYSIATDEYRSMYATPSPGATSLLTPADDRSFGWSTDVRAFNAFELDETSAAFDLQGEAGGRNVGVIGATADFAFINFPLPSMTGTVATGPLAYGVPTGSWDTFAAFSAQQVYIVQLRCPVDATPCPTLAGWARQLVGHAVTVGYSDARLVDATAFAPGIGPARDLRIAGLDAMQFTSAVGTQPTISWSTTSTVPSSSRALAAPELFNVTVYHYRLDSSSGQWRTSRETVASFTTTHTSIEVPAGLLTPGEVYSFVVDSARRDATVGISPMQEPNRFRYPAEEWSVTSAPFSP